VQDPIEARDPEAQFAPPDVKGMAAAITVTAQISQQRSIVIQTYLDRDAPISMFHDVLDKFDRAIGRQEAKTNLEENVINLAIEERTLKQLTEDFNSIELRSQADWLARNKKGQHKLTQAEEAQKETAKTNIRRYQEAITKRKSDIAKLQGIIAEGD
jgi:hypothetical protein